MESFGQLAHEVLRDYGIAEINPDQQYSYKIRSAIHKAALDRFGEVSVLVFGFNHAERSLLKICPIVVDHFPDIRNKIDVRSTASCMKGLYEFIEFMVKDLNADIRGATRGIDGVKYGFFEENKSEDIATGLIRISFKGVMAAMPHQEAFLRGVVLYILTKFINKYFNFIVKPELGKNASGIGFSEFHLTVEFENKIAVESEIELLWRKKLSLREELTKQVLNNSNSQNQTLKILSEQLGKYIPPQIHSALIKGDYDASIKTRRKKLTIFFSDIKNFTSTSEALQPEDLTKYLNEYFSEMTKIALDFGATIDKYIGDAMMVFFGDPETNGEKEDARACVEMALTMQERMRELQNKWSNQGFSDPFQVRMGINTGYCNVGNFGSDQRLTYTIIGGEVNVAQRLESASDSNGILLSYETYAHVRDKIEVEERDAIKMKGISREVKVYAVAGRRVMGKRMESIEEAELHIDKQSDSLALTEVDDRFQRLEDSVKDIKGQIESLSEKIQNRWLK